MPEQRPPKLSLRSLLRPTVEAQPLRPALHGQHVWTYGGMDERTSRQWHLANCAQ